jgi:hypothetical protein
MFPSHPHVGFSAICLFLKLVRTAVQIGTQKEIPASFTQVRQLIIFRNWNILNEVFYFEVFSIVDQQIDSGTWSDALSLCVPGRYSSFLYYFSCVSCVYTAGDTHWTCAAAGMMHGEIPNVKQYSILIFKLALIS